MSRALLFINGEPPKTLPSLADYQLIACTDGAFHYLKEKNFPLEKLAFISGDFDSHTGADEAIYQGKFVHTPDQNKTDFHKALEIIVEKGIKKVDVYGASGREQDHFLGNIHTAYLFREELEIIPNDFTIRKVKGKMVSLLPFPMAENIFTQGLHWELRGENLSLMERIGTRNRADTDEISIKYDKGSLLLFIEN